MSSEPSRRSSPLPELFHTLLGLMTIATLQLYDYCNEPTQLT